jgi:DNA replication protein DnaC
MQTQAKSTWRAFPPAAAREDCALCRGTGWRLVPGSAGASARPCPCRELGRLLELKNRVRVPERYTHCTLDSYSPANPSQERALCAARRFVQNYPRVERDLFFVGGPGSGKTHLALGIARELVHRFCEDVLFIDFGQWIAEQTSGGDFPVGRGNPGWEAAEQAALLIVDDFGMVQPAPRAVFVTESLVRARIGARRRTIYTGEWFRCRALFSEGAPPPAASSSEMLMRTFSPHTLLRLLGGVKVIPVRGRDFRKQDRRSPLLFSY